MSVYLIKYTDLTPDVLRAGTPNEHFEVQSEPGRKNMSHQPCTEGWLGTTNDSHAVALGEFADVATARAAAESRLGTTHVLSDAPFGEDNMSRDDNDRLRFEDELLAIWYVVPAAYDAIWDAGDWLDKSIALQALEEHGGDIDATVAALEAEAASERIRVDGLRERLRWVQEQVASDATE